MDKRQTKIVDNKSYWQNLAQRVHSMLYIHIGRAEREEHRI